MNVERTFLESTIFFKCTFAKYCEMFIFIRVTKHNFKIVSLLYSISYVVANKYFSVSKYNWKSPQSRLIETIFQLRVFLFICISYFFFVLSSSCTHSLSCLPYKSPTTSNTKQINIFKFSTKSAWTSAKSFLLICQTATEHLCN